MSAYGSAYSSMSSIVDFHTHAFPNELAPSALEKLEASSGIRAFTSGTVDALLESMDRAEISRSVVHSVATSPSQTDAIRLWSLSIRSDRIIPFPSVHPDSSSLAGDLRHIAEDGFRGIKLHPLYQDFRFDEEKMFPLYENCLDLGLVILFHVGEDISYPPSDQGSPSRLAAVLDSCPGLKIVAAHTGGWHYWHETVEYLLGRDVYLDLSYTHGHLEEKAYKKMILGHRPDRLLFGSDSPWDDQKTALQNLEKMDLPKDLMKRILFQNAETLLPRLI